MSKRLMNRNNLSVVVFVGSARDSVPPWGGPKRLATRVRSFVEKELTTREVNYVVFDPVDIKLPVLDTPHFYYEKGKAPEQLEKMANELEKADGFLLISGEYNHSAPPALTNMLDYFGGSKYAYKPSGLITYSAGPFGGARAQMNLRAITGELGCLSVSNIFTIPSAGKTLDESGTPAEPERMKRNFQKMFGQFEWMANAMKNHRDLVGTP